MGFLQIIDFHTDRLDEFHTLHEQWLKAAEGRRTTTSGQIYADRDHPGHYIGLDWFTDHDSAMVNSDLPATTAMAEKAQTFATGPVTFHNLEPVGPPHIEGADELRRSLETSTLVRHAFAEDVRGDLIVPGGRVLIHGTDELEAGLRQEAPARRLVLWDAQPTPDGFAVEYAYRTLGEVETLAVGAVIAQVRHGKVQRLFITCGGNWDAATQEQVHATTGELGSALVGSAS